MTDLVYSSSKGSPLRSPIPWLIVVLWFAAIYALAARGAFVEAEPGPPVRLLPAVLLPPAVFILAYRALHGLRDWVAALDPVIVTAAQGWRVVGAVFLMLWGMGMLPAVFAIPAGIGDMAVGVFAVYVTAGLARRSATWRTDSRRLIALGLADFVMVFAIASLVASSPSLTPDGAPWAQVMQTLPMTLIPAFAVPGFIILHIIAWLKID